MFAIINHHVLLGPENSISSLTEKYRTNAYQSLDEQPTVDDFSNQRGSSEVMLQM